MDKKITITVEQYKCLREHLKQAMQILDSLGIDGSVTTPKPAKPETKAERVNKYKNLIDSGTRAKKPDHLRKKK